MAISLAMLLELKKYYNFHIVDVCKYVSYFCITNNIHRITDRLVVCDNHFLSLLEMSSYKDIVNLFLLCFVHVQLRQTYMLIDLNSSPYHGKIL